MNKITDEQFKTLMDLFYDMDICDMNDNISDEIDREYSFKPRNNQLRVEKKLFDLIPENWSVRYFEGEEDNVESCTDFTRYFLDEEKKK